MTLAENNSRCDRICHRDVCESCPVRESQGRVGGSVPVLPDHLAGAGLWTGGRSFACSGGRHPPGFARTRWGCLYAAGWVPYHPATIRVPEQEPARFSDDQFGQTAVMVVAPCVADPSRIRLIAHISGNLTEVFPYLNTQMHTACFNRNGPTFTFMDGHRMISLYPRRITIAKADEIVDAWRTLEAIRCRVNGTWAHRAEITPSYEMREKPPALEIFKRLPRTNCRACGELTCLAFAVKLWSGGGQPSQCQPVFTGDFAHLRPATGGNMPRTGRDGRYRHGERSDDSEIRSKPVKKLQILGTGCPKCKKLAENTETAAKALGIEYEHREGDRHQRDHEVRRDDDPGVGHRRPGQGRRQGALAG